MLVIPHLVIHPVPKRHVGPDSALLPVWIEETLVADDDDEETLQVVDAVDELPKNLVGLKEGWPGVALARRCPVSPDRSWGMR